MRAPFDTISIHAPREGGDPEYGYVLGGCHGISIHAPREGGDIDFDAIKKGTMDISIHAPREGGDSPEI